MRIYTISIILLLLPIIGFCQNRWLCGRVFDYNQDKEIIVKKDATIALVSKNYPEIKTKTDSVGCFCFRRLHKGLYTLQAYKEDTFTILNVNVTDEDLDNIYISFYERNKTIVREYEACCLPFRTITPVPPSSIPRPITLKIHVDGHLSKPLDSAIIEIDGFTNMWFTDDNGNTIIKLLPDRYNVKISHGNYLSSITQGIITTEGKTTNLNIRLQKARNRKKQPVVTEYKSPEGKRLGKGCPEIKLSK